ncbi:MAG: DNA topoisomerase III [Epulopiscium sp.]|nr:DNA topoisomerase III [Candidatus Epulonipiscium sp.]
MGKILVIAEKPSVGKDIAKVLECKEKGEGCLIGEKYIVTWAIGHLVRLLTPEEYDVKYKRWSYETLPIIPEQMKTKPERKTKKQFDILKKLMNSKEIDYLICATDSGREGELIFRYIYEAVKCKKPFKRLWISSMTDSAIKKGFETLKPGEEYDALYHSAKCRSEADWLVGMNASRAFSIRYNVLLSIGRVQTPTLSILVQRQKEIDEFVPKDYWEVKADFNGFKGTWIDLKNNETKIFEEEKALKIADKVKGKSGIIKDLSQEKKKQAPPLLYDLTELQRDGNKMFGFSASKTLSIAQDLYEKRKMITYPRTDSRYVSTDMIPVLKSTLHKLNIPVYSRFVQPILDRGDLPISKRIVDDSKVTDHYAIIPTDSLPKLERLTEDEKKIYGLIVKRFFAVFYADYEYTITKVITEIENEHFITKGKMVSQLGWMLFYKNDAKKNEEEQELPVLKKEDPVTVMDVKTEKKKTSPPKPYTEATLLSAMENAGRLVEDEELKEQLKDSGLGTPATRASIIERLIQVGYVIRKGKALYPTEKGMKLIEIVPQEVKSPETTGKWEKGLSSIVKSKMDPKKFMQSIIRYVYFIVEESSKLDHPIAFPAEAKKKTTKKSGVLGKCPLCNKGDIKENTRAFYCSEWNAGCKFTLWKNSLEQYGQAITSKMVKELLKNKKIKGINIILPQTHEKATADVQFKPDGNGAVELINVNRL